ncbi:MAG: hypothetical protein RLZ14_1734 [Actinomycetota bacterium]
MSSNNQSNRSKPIDPLLAQRIEALSRRKGAPLPPPAAAAPAASPAGNSTAVQKIAAARAAAGASRPGQKPVGKAGKRVKPARGAKAASLALSVVTTGALTALFARSETTSDSVQLVAGTASATLTPATAPAVAPATAPVVTTPVVAPVTAAPVTAAPVTAAPAPAGIADGTYQGSPSQNRFGVVQVQAVYSGGQLADVQVLQYPSGDRRSLRISQYSLPRLIDQALSAQGTNISGISGATYTSRSYVKSLQSAIDAAKAASGISG